MVTFGGLLNMGKSFAGSTAAIASFATSFSISKEFNGFDTDSIIIGTKPFQLTFSLSRILLCRHWQWTNRPFYCHVTSGGKGPLRQTCSGWSDWFRHRSRILRRANCASGWFRHKRFFWFRKIFSSRNVPFSCLLLLDPLPHAQD